MTKFVKKKRIVSEDCTPKQVAEILAINVQQASICKSMNAIDIGTRAKILLADGKMFPDESVLYRMYDVLPGSNTVPT